MARSSRKETEKHRQQIIDGAAELLRERGVAGVNVGELMAQAGLTHGGFYRHFGSKEELVRLAVAKAFSDQRDWLDGQTEQQVIDYYLSPEHRDDFARGCTVGALGGELARAERETREAFAAGAGRFFEAFADLEGREREEAMARYATMVGALVISRATAGSPLSDEILEVARQSLRA
jgi:TetR/AcrR family transcriptional repressor of nem operon